MLCCIEQKAASRREKIPPGTKFLVKHDTILQQKEKLRIDTARLVWDNGGNKQNAKGVVTMPPRTSLAERPVGGIDSWGADVEDAYHVSGEGNHSVAFRVLL